MLAELKFVRGVIKKNKISPELEHYQIKDGRVTGYNGYLALSAPVDLDFTAYPHADTFSRAVETCSGNIALNLTPSGRLSVSSSGFRAFVNCLEQTAFEVAPVGQEYDIPKGFADDLAALFPFISDDASRPWAMGLLLHAGVYMATNNIVFVQKWSGHQLPRINLPRFTVQELIRVGVDPIKVQTDGNSVTFLYDNGRWIRSQLYTDDWPFERINQLLDQETNPVPLPAGFADAIEKLRPFADGKAAPLYFEEGGIGTTTESGEGVHVDIEGLPAGPIFSVRQLELLPTVVTKVDWSLYPNPCLFYGERLRGVMVGRVS